LSERYLTTREFAEIIGVSRSTVISWVKSDRIVLVVLMVGGGSPIARLRGYSKVLRELNA
jgi:excisionase family DNA binding protein